MMIHATNDTIILQGPDDSKSSLGQSPDEKQIEVQGQECPLQDRVQITLDFDALNPNYSLSDVLSSRGITVDPGFQWPMPESMRKYQSPFTWSTGRKVTTLTGLFIASTLSAHSAGSYAFGSGPLQAKWNISDTEFAVGMTLFTLSFGVSPMIMAPISEGYGRYWVFIAAGIVFFLGTLGCAVTDSFAGMLVARFVTGMGASIFVTITGGVVSDLYHKDQRNTPMTLYSMTVLIGAGIGPMVSGIAVDHLQWRWIYWLQLIAIGLATAAICFFFTETRSNVLLRRKCHALNSFFESQATRLRPHPWFQEVETWKPSLGADLLWKSFAFPMKLLITESVVLWFSVWASFAWAILYMQFGSVILAFRDVYGFSDTQIGLVYISVILGSIAGTILSIVQEPISHRLFPHRMNAPEGRLLPACVSSVLLPVGLFWFGWTTSQDIHWLSPTFAIGACTTGIFCIYLSSFNYLADTYHRYASSALAAQAMCRNLLGGVFPLFTSVMYRNLSYGAVGCMLGGIAIGLTAVPWLLSIFGERIRARSPFAGELVHSQRKEEV